MFRTLIIWSIATMLAMVSIFLAIGGITKNKLPETAITVPIVNGFAYKAAALHSMQNYISGNGDTLPAKADPRTIKLARLAFLSEPTTSEAVALMALSRDGRVREKLMENAMLLSKRNQFAIGWMILNSSANDDIAGVLEYYDISIRTSPSTAELLLPIMVSLLKYENAVQPLAEIMKKDPPWMSGFWYNVLMQKDAMTNAVKLRLALMDSELPVSDFQDDALLTSLVNNGYIANAETLYNSLKPRQATNIIVHDGDFDMHPTYTPFDWQLFSNGEYGAEIFDGSLNLSAISNAGGIFARQLVTLPNGKFNLQISMDKPNDGNETISVQLSCAEIPSKRLNPVNIPLRSRKTERILDNSPGICRYYWLNIVGSPSDRGYDARLYSIKIN